MRKLITFQNLKNLLASKLFTPKQSFSLTAQDTSRYRTIVQRKHRRQVSKCLRPSLSNTSVLLIILSQIHPAVNHSLVFILNNTLTELMKCSDRGATCLYLTAS